MTNWESRQLKMAANLVFSYLIVTTFSDYFQPIKTLNSKFDTVKNEMCYLGLFISVCMTQVYPTEKQASVRKAGRVRAKKERLEKLWSGVKHLLKLFML